MYICVLHILMEMYVCRDQIENSNRRHIIELSKNFFKTLLEYIKIKSKIFYAYIHTYIHT